jgi:hypothetical protein
MKAKLFGLMVIVSWLSVSPAGAITLYDYNVDIPIGPGLGKVQAGTITGSIQTNCDTCDLTSSNVTSWSLQASDGSSINSSGPTSGITFEFTILQATPTGIFTLDDVGSFNFCADTSSCGAPAGGLLFTNNSGPNGLPHLAHVDWYEGTSIIYENGVEGGWPVYEVAPLADTLVCPINGNCLSIPAPTPLPAAFPLFVTGLGAMGLLGWRRKRKSAAALAPA